MRQRLACTVRRANFGFSLLEILIAVLVLSLGLLALGKLYLRTQQSTAVSKQRSEAVAAGRAKLEELRATTYASLTSDSDTALSGSGASASLARVWTVTACPGVSTTCTPSGTEFKEVVLTVSWKDSAGADQSMTLTTRVNAISPSNSASLISSTTTTSSSSISTSTTSSTSSTTASSTSTTAATTTTTSVATTTTTAAPTTTTTTAAPTTTTTTTTTTSTVNTAPVVTLTGTYAGCTPNPANAAPCNNIKKNTDFTITLTATDNTSLASTSVSASVSGGGNPSVVSTGYSGTTGTVVVKSANGNNQTFSVTITVTDAGGVTTSRTLYFRSVN